jgi:replicative DNA helicase
MTNEISAGLARIAKDLKIPIVALSQLSRTVESTKDKIPDLQHLKESGNLEEDAYSVIFLYRPEYYGFETFTEENKDELAKDKAQILVAKHKNGKLGAPIVTFEKEKMLFKDIESGFTQFPISNKRIESKGKEEHFTDF